MLLIERQTEDLFFFLANKAVRTFSFHLASATTRKQSSLIVVFSAVWLKAFEYFCIDKLKIEPPQQSSPIGVGVYFQTHLHCKLIRLSRRTINCSCLFLAVLKVPSSSFVFHSNLWDYLAMNLLCLWMHFNPVTALCKYTLRPRHTFVSVWALQGQGCKLKSKYNLCNRFFIQSKSHCDLLLKTWRLCVESVIYSFCFLGINQRQNTRTTALSWHNHPYVLNISQ